MLKPSCFWTPFFFFQKRSLSLTCRILNKRNLKLLLMPQPVRVVGALIGPDQPHMGLPTILPDYGRANSVWTMLQECWSPAQAQPFLAVKPCWSWPMNWFLNLTLCLSCRYRCAQQSPAVVWPCLLDLILTMICRTWQRPQTCLMTQTSSWTWLPSSSLPFLSSLSTVRRGPAWQGPSLLLLLTL